jgi:2-hydroxychromene-2-carboxylate isomerase
LVKTPRTDSPPPPQRGEGEIDFFFEFGSSYSYLAAWRIQALAAAANLRVRWRPFLLGPIFEGQGWSTSPFNLYPAKGRYMWRDMERLCASHGLAFERPSQFPRNGLLAARVACGGRDEPWLADFVRAIYRANFADDQDIALPQIVAQVLTDVGGPADALERARTPDTKQLLREETETAQQLGIFGAPSFIARGELFWGNDRLEDAIRWASAAPGDE